MTEPTQSEGEPTQFEGEAEQSQRGPEQSQRGPDQSDTGPRRSTGVADRVRLSYRALDRGAVQRGEDDRRDGDGSGFADNHLIHERIQERPFRAYLRRVHDGPVSVGDEWTEFVNCGCGTTTDVVLRVEAVDAGFRICEDTAFDLHPFGGTDATD